MLRECTSCEIKKELIEFVRQGNTYRYLCKYCSNLRRRKNTISNTIFKKGQIPWNKCKKGLQIAWNKGISMPEEVKNKVSASKKGQAPWIKGKKHTQETKLKISLSKTGTPASKENREKIKSKWLTRKLDFSRRSEIYKDWRNEILKRDEFKCQKCGEKENLHVHHIIPYEECPEKRVSIDNGLTLCQFCHLSLEHKGKIVSKETGKKISLSKKGKPSSFIGCKHSEESKKKMSISKKMKNKANK